MESPASKVATLFEMAEEYGKTTYDLYKLKLVDTASVVSTSIIARMGVIMMLSLCVLVLSIGVALFLGELIGKIYYGFFIIAGAYLVAVIVMHYFLHTWIKKPISESIIKQSLQNGISWKN